MTLPGPAFLLKIKKNLHNRRFLIRGKKVAFQKLISDGDSGFGNKLNNRFLQISIMGIKNGSVRIIGKTSGVKRKGSRNTPLFNP
jgi:hypothetical protein